MSNFLVFQSVDEGMRGAEGTVVRPPLGIAPLSVQNGRENSEIPGAQSSPRPRDDSPDTLGRGRSPVEEEIARARQRSEPRAESLDGKEHGKFLIAKETWAKIRKPAIFRDNPDHQPSDNDALLVANFIFTGADKPADWKCKSLCSRISLDASPQDLCRYLESSCVYAQRLNSACMHRLNREGKGLDIKGAISFERGRD